MSAEPNGRRGGRNMDRMLAIDLCIDPTLHAHTYGRGMIIRCDFKGVCYDNL